MVLRYKVNWFLNFGCFFARLVLSLRYSVKVKGKKELCKFAEKESLLFLPNHPAHVDPILVVTHLWPIFKIRPIVVEYIYRQPGIYRIMKWLHALSIPNMDTALTEMKTRKVNEVIETIIKGLEEKENYILYPSGHLKNGGREIVGGASSGFTILERCPSVRVVLVRTSGLWGSSFSKAYTEKSPDFKATVLKGIKELLKSAIFFMPRRRVEIEFLRVEDLPKFASRLEFNHYLEEWYNRYHSNGEVVEEEPLNLVSYSPWKYKILKPLDRSRNNKKRAFKEIPEKVRGEVFKELVRISGRKEITDDMNLALDLGLDSLEMAELVSFLDISDLHPQDMETVGDVLLLAAGEKREREVEKSTFSWGKEPFRKDPGLPEGKTIMEVFLSICKRMDSALACGDDIIGTLSYSKMKLAVLLLSKEIEKLEGKNIGVLLPSSSAAYLVILAILFAKKVPVMLNWTLGSRYLNDMIALTQVESVISSWRFLERLSNVELGNVEQKVIFLEDLKSSISLRKKICALFRSKMPIAIEGKENDVAVILFTSGSEASPKGVPLSHKNILSNQRAALSCAQINKEDVFLGTLPPFHSFGFSLVGLLPLLSGVRVVYMPDPTDSYALAEGIKRWQVSIVCLAPSFLKGLLNAADRDELKSVRYFVVGAEKAPEELFEKVAGLNSLLIEGYGITECAPVITLNRPDKPPKGVGEPLPDIELCVIGLEDQRLLKEGEEGEICVKGPNVFSGYLSNVKFPFLDINGERWYRTGDLGYLEGSYLILSGRIKRFAKIAGEMISLGGIEEVIYSRVKNGEEGPLVAVCEEKSKLILFTTLSLDKDRINQILKEEGFSRLVKIDEVRKVKEIPIMGTGKVNYRALYPS